MSEKDWGMKKDKDPPAIQKIRTEEPQAPFGGDEPNPNVVSDLTAEEKAAGEPVDPAPGGYGDRDPKSEMPAMPSVPSTQGDAAEHGGEPKTDKEPPASTERV